MELIVLLLRTSDARAEKNTSAEPTRLKKSTAAELK